MVAAGSREHEERLRRSRRLARGAEIRAALGRGKRSRTAHLDVYDSASPVARSRVGVIVPRYGRTAVERNRLKRRLREILRIEILPRLRTLGAGTDVLVRARPTAYDATFARLRDQLLEWLERRWPRDSSSA